MTDKYVTAYRNIREENGDGLVVRWLFLGDMSTDDDEDD
jgi:hypothetical protein